MNLKVVIALVGVVVTVHGAAVSEVKVVKHIHHSPEPEHHEKHGWGHPSYMFSYKVEDHKTHDIKGQHEIREGKMVRGEYWLIEPDGAKRTVKYHTDEHGGFHTLVIRTPSHHHHEGPMRESARDPAPVEEQGGEEASGAREAHKPVHHSQLHYEIHHHKPHHPVVHYQVHHPVHHSHHSHHSHKLHGHHSKHHNSYYRSGQEGRVESGQSEGEEGGQEGGAEGAAEGGEEK